MKTTFAILYLTFLTFICKAQGNHELIVNFQPSFISHSVLSIKETNKKAVITLKIYGRNEKESVLIKEERKLQKNELDSLLSFFASYQFKIKGSIDTVGTSEVTLNGKTAIGHHVSIGMDGISVKGSFVDENQNKDFAFWSPKVNSENYKLITKVFDLMEVSLKKKAIQSYMIQLKAYF
jgi:hypothetical protein